MPAFADDAQQTTRQMPGVHSRAHLRGVCAERKHKSSSLTMTFLVTDTGEDPVPGSAAAQLKQRSLRGGGMDPQRSPRTVHACGGRSVAASLLVWGAAPETACGWGVTPP